jgi:hypothetical protein
MIRSGLLRFGSVLCLVSACRAGPAALSPLAAQARAEAVEQCRAVFPRGQWRATHVVEARMPLGNEGSFIGVVAAGPGTDAFRSLLMTQEGFVLFDARYRAGGIEVLRALPPLDPQGFGRGMTGDVRLLLFPPAGELVEVGKTREGQPACRWLKGKETVEVALTGAGKARLSRWDDGSLAREAELSEIDRRGFARHARLETKGMVGYSLSLDLLDVEQAGETSQPRSATSQGP